MVRRDFHFNQILIEKKSNKIKQSNRITTKYSQFLRRLTEMTSKKARPQHITLRSFWRLDKCDIKKETKCS